MQISLTHPAVIIGVIDRPDSPSVSSTGNVDPAIQHLALQAEPSITAILKIWELRQKQRGAFLTPPSWLIVFGFLITVDGAVTIVAHYPNLDGIAEQPGSGESGTASGMRFCSCIVDKLRFHPEVWWDIISPVKQWKGPANDDVWIMDRLRLVIALITLVMNSTLIVAIWDDIDWPREILEAEDTLEKQHAQWDLCTPNPSEDLWNEDDDDFMGQIWEGDCYDSEDDQAALEASWLRVSEWRKTAYLVE